MEITFWGVRGSVATAGPETLQVGGNTSCVEVRAGGALIILDAGTGLRGLGAALARRGRVEAALLLSHFHWDHIQGFPFFAPAYVPGNRLTLHAAVPARGGGAHRPDDDAAVRGAPAPGGEDRGDDDDAAVRGAFEAQMRAPHFPVGLDAMRATLAFRAVAPGAAFPVGGATVRAASARHPDGCLAYRIDEPGGRSLVYATDTEHDVDGGRPDPALVELAAGADVLVYDAQYTQEEYRAGKRGWGHSTAEEGARIARAAGVGELVLFHHDPSHDDWQIARIEAATRALFPRTLAAREGLRLTLEGRRVAA